MALRSILEAETVCLGSKSQPGVRPAGYFPVVVATALYCREMTWVLSDLVAELTVVAGALFCGQTKPTLGRARLE